MTKEKNEMAAFAEKFMAVYKGADEAALRELLDPDFKLWSSAIPAGGEVGADQLVTAAKWEAENIHLELTDVRVQSGDGGYVQQCVLRGKGPDGSEFAVPNCMVVTVADGKVKRLDEYVITPAPETG